ncbi:MAG: sodium:proton antiporter, partial [Halobacteria archaeon]|nr:sodium:proton antiporter [Halobacteria archaeon]
TMERALDLTNIITRSDPEELYELLIGRAQAVNNALETVEELHDSGQIPDVVYEDFKDEYGREKEELNRAIASLLSEYPEIHEEQVRMGERLVLKQEKSSIIDAMRQGTVSDSVGEELLNEIDLKLDRLSSGESTVSSSEREGYEEFWRERAREYGLDFELEE